MSASHPRNFRSPHGFAEVLPNMKRVPNLSKAADEDVTLWILNFNFKLEMKMAASRQGPDPP